MELTTKQQLRNCRKNVRRLKEKVTNDSKPDLDKLIEKYEDYLEIAIEEKNNPNSIEKQKHRSLAYGKKIAYTIIVADLKGLRDL